MLAFKRLTLCSPAYTRIEIHLPLPFSPPITRRTAKRYVLGEPFLLQQETWNEKLGGSRVKSASVWVGEQKVELLLRILFVIGYMLVMHS
jgi:hypothetical protein